MPEDESEIDDKKFFLSPQGNKDAKAELEATLRSLYDEAYHDDNATACRFPARTWWLKKELSLTDLPEVECKAFNTLQKKVDPRSASLVFPSAYINSPASMFGHTFIRIDSTYKSRMLSYAINYAANADSSTENGMVFAIKGLVGGYFGNYSLLPYYEKIKEYRDTEERDMWEYDLDLTQAEMQQMLRHIWEIHDTYSWYYFFTENCSYNMLWLIEAAREGINLRKYFNYQVLPPETIHASLNEGIITKAHYRPARRSKLLAYENFLEDEQIHRVFELARFEKDPKSFTHDDTVDIQDRRYILEAASEFVEYDFLSGDINASIYKKRLHTILTNRAGLGRGDKIDTPTPIDPMNGHRALRVRSELGVRDDRLLGFIGVRPANHDITDSDVGFLRGTQIEFLNALLSFDEDEVDIENLGLIKIVSLAPRTKFFKPVSWRLNTGWDRNYLSDGAKFTTNASAGLTWANDDAYLYLLADVLMYNENDMTAGMGGVAGAVLFIDEFKTNIEMTQRYYDSGDEQFVFSFSQNFRYSQNKSFSIKYDYVEKFHQDMKTAKLSFDYFF